MKFLDENTEICVKYMDRVVRFKVIMFHEEKALVVIQASNSSLLPNDILLIHKIKRVRDWRLRKFFEVI